VHAHAALFGVYGFLAIGFTLLVLRYVVPGFRFNEKLMRTGFWGLNAGLVLMIFTSLLPIGLIQIYASVSVGMWYARREEIMLLPLLDALRGVGTFVDMVFMICAQAIFWQVFLGVFRPKSYAGQVPYAATAAAE